MDSAGVVVESTVSGDQIDVPAAVRQELDVVDKDTLRWHVEDGTVRVDVVRQRCRTFQEFDGYEGDAPSDVTADHDAWSADGV
ncbi:MAG: AbrB/MazE/SpoVT family DNA-binding domain-containing protein [Halobacteriaceae archaeon]